MSRKHIEDVAAPLDIVFSLETNAIILSQSSFSEACSKFSGEKSLSEYIKRCDSFVEPLEPSLGFNTKIQKADTIQYIHLYETLNVLLSHKMSQEVIEDECF